ncbi:MBL fold metallo-hydrolase [Parasphingorhabdus sp.]|uniref:MBL fold metallo-hydrolase n=1 Tax=Parasphingorhabdus sp. TaxID=2709688 RepID=UPI003A94B741
MKKLGMVLLVLGLIAIAVGLIFREQIGKRLFAAAVETAVARDVIGDMPDGINVALCGSGSPLPDPTRAGPCSAVIIDGKMFIVDIGGGAVRNLGLMGLNPGATEALLLTHFHSDHIDGMGELMLQRWAGGGRDAPLPVIAPEGVEVIVDGLNAAYAADVQYRIAHHGAKTMPVTGAGGTAQPFSLPDGQDQTVVYDQDGIKITAFSVAHKPIKPAVGYRFDYKGRSVVFSGDTVKLPIVAKICNGCDLLVHEVLNAEMVGTLETAFEKTGRQRLTKIMADIPDYHTTPVEAAQTASAAKAEMLILSHVVPALPVDYLDAYFMAGVNVAYDGPVVLGKDGMLFSLPANKDSIEQDDLL